MKILQIISIIILIVGMIAAAILLVDGTTVIHSDKPIKPRIDLVIRNNQIDTIYVYKKP